MVFKFSLAPKLTDCELKCAMSPVEMGTFICPSQCDDLSSKTMTEQILVYVSRLTDGDKIVTSKMPYEALKVF